MFNYVAHFLACSFFFVPPYVFSVVYSLFILSFDSFVCYFIHCWFLFFLFFLVFVCSFPFFNMLVRLFFHLLVLSVICLFVLSYFHV